MVEKLYRSHLNNRTLNSIIIVNGSIRIYYYQILTLDDAKFVSGLILKEFFYLPRIQFLHSV